MCKKNDYGRKMVTAILAVLTALFVLSLMSGGANASPVKAKALGGNAFAAVGSPQLKKSTLDRCETSCFFRLISKAPRKFL